MIPSSLSQVHGVSKNEELLEGTSMPLAFKDLTSAPLLLDAHRLWADRDNRLIVFSSPKGPLTPCSTGSSTILIGREML